MYAEFMIQPLDRYGLRLDGIHRRREPAIQADSRRALPVNEAFEIARQICAGLREAHTQGIVHRDLKPAISC